jgi:hypothetical protein
MSVTQQGGGGVPQFVINGSAAMGPTTDPQIFWGYASPGQLPTTVPGGKGKDGAWIIPGKKDNTPVTIGATQAQGYLYQLAQNDPSQLEAYRQRMIAAGVLDPKDASFAKMQGVWMDALGASADAYASGTNLTPWDAIDLLGAGGTGPDGPKNGTFSVSVNDTRTESSTASRVNLSSASEARAFLLAAAEQQLGRAATTDEIAAFRAALNAEEKANPEVLKSSGTSKTTGTRSSTYTDGEVTATADNTNTSNTSNSTETGGMDRGQYAIDYARSADDYAEYQAATTYMNTLFAALASPTEVGTN